MARIDFEGWDEYTLTNAPGMFNVNNAANNSALGDGFLGYGRHGVGGTAAAGTGRNFANQTQLFANFHFRNTVAPGTGTFFWFVDAASVQVGLRWSAGGNLVLVRGSTVVATSPLYVYPANTWIFLQFYALINNVAGAMEAWVNGVSVVSFAGDTTQTANEFVNGWRYSFSGNNSTHFDNLLIYNTAGAAPNARTGETRAFYSLPSAPGPVTQLTPVGAAANWECTDDNPPDADATYVQAAVAPLTDVYDIPANAVPAGSTVYAVANRAYARKDDAGVNDLDLLLRSGGVNYPSGAPTALNASYTIQRTVWDVDPATGLAWTVTGANDALPGITRTA